jgi:hypothetical protein
VGVATRCCEIDAQYTCESDLDARTCDFGHLDVDGVVRVEKNSEALRNH